MTANDRELPSHTAIVLNQQQIYQLTSKSLDRHIPEQYDNWSLKKRLQWLKKTYRQLKPAGDAKDLPPNISIRYAIKRFLFYELYTAGIKTEAIEICKKENIHPGDLDWKIMCADTLSETIALDETLTIFKNIIGDAKNLNNLEAEMWANHEKAWVLSSNGMITEALSTYQFILDQPLKEFPEYVNDAYLNMATIYIIHGNQEYVKKGVDLLNQVIQRYKNTHPKSQEKINEMNINLEVANFNIGVAYALHLGNYKSAIPYFKNTIAMQGSLVVDAKIFLALSLSEVNKTEPAKLLIEDLTLRASTTAIKRAYLTCYLHIIKEQWSSTSDLSPCYRLTNKTPIEVRRDIYKRLISNSNEHIRNKGLSLFYSYYVTNIEPELKKRSSREASNNEVNRFKLESELKNRLLESEKKLKVSEEKQNNLLMATLIASTLVSMLIIGFVMSNLRRKSILADKLNELGEAKSRFFTNISHEFRTAATLAVGPLKYLSQDPSIQEKEREQLIASALNNNLHMMHLINQFLDVEKLESGKMSVQLEPLVVSQVLNNCLDRFQSKFDQEKITLVTQGFESEESIYFDHDHLDKIFTNLISNAIKFSNEGSKIKVSISEKRLKDNIVEISVIDYGLGIDEKELEHVFNRFYQGKSSSSLQQPGTGVGLALVYDLIKLHNGEIKLTSEKNKGTEFVIQLKKGIEHYSQEQQKSFQHLNTSIIETNNSLRVTAITENIDSEIAQNKEENQTDSQTKQVILVVDDNKDVQDLLQTLLKKQYRVACDGDGAAAFETALKIQPDLIISDIMMPVMDGLQLTQKLKSMEETQHIPLILLSAKATQGDQLEGLLEGADDYLTKPFLPEELMTRVTNLLANRKRFSQKLYRDFMRSNDTGSSSSKLKVDFFPQKIQTTITEHLSREDFTVPELAALMNTSQSKLLRLCKKHFQCSPIQLIRKKRLELAKQLLRQNNTSVSEVAYAVGFQSFSSFSRAYTEYHGLSPSAEKTRVP